MSMPETIDGKRDSLMQLYIPHDITNVRCHFYEQDNSHLYRHFCTKIVQHFHKVSKDMDSLSVYDDESDEEYYGA